MRKFENQNPYVIILMVIAIAGSIYFFSQHSNQKTSPRSKNSQSGTTRTGKTTGVQNIVTSSTPQINNPNQSTN